MEEPAESPTTPGSARAQHLWNVVRTVVLPNEEAKREKTDDSVAPWVKDVQDPLLPAEVCAAAKGRVGVGTGCRVHVLGTVGDQSIVFRVRRRRGSAVVVSVLAVRRHAKVLRRLTGTTRETQVVASTEHPLPTILHNT